MYRRNRAKKRRSKREHASEHEAEEQAKDEASRRACLCTQSRKAGTNKNRSLRESLRAQLPGAQPACSDPHLPLALFLRGKRLAA